MIYNPTIETIKNKYILSDREKEILNFFHNQLRIFDKNIEAYVHGFIHNTYINIAYILENKGIFIITNNNILDETNSEDEKDSENFLSFLNYFNNLVKLNSKDKLYKGSIYFSNLEENNNTIFNNFKKYYNTVKDASPKESEILHSISLEFKSMLYSRYGNCSNLESEKVINFTKKQIELIKKQSSFKVKGPAGSGKTIILLSKVIYEYKEKKSRNLIIVFNITARNMLREKLFNLSEDLDKCYINIVHYHGLSKELQNNILYDNIFVDEAQDFQKSWYVYLEKYLAENGNLYIFGDEKQNIYKRELESKNIFTPIPGAWNQLKSSYRIEGRVVDLALNFQKTYFQNIYEIDSIEKNEKLKYALNFVPLEKNEIIKYKYFQSINSLKNSEIGDYIQKTITKNNLDLNKTAILTLEIECLLPIMETFKQSINYKCITCETPEEATNFGKETLDKIRRNRKLNFEPFSNSLIFSTIHSFKGMERENIIFIFSDTKNKFSYKLNELIYTGLTRSKKNLFLINIGLDTYNKFFEKFI